jgi:hypothetical protein
MLHATPAAAAPAAAEAVRQPGALPGLIAAGGADWFTFVSLNAWQRLVEAGVAREDLARGVAEAGACGALRRIAGAAQRLYSDNPAKDKEFLVLTDGLTALCQHELAAEAVAANTGVVGALRHALRSGTRVAAALRLLLELKGATRAAPRRAAGDLRGGGGGGGSLGDPQRLQEVVRAAASEDSDVCLLAFRFIGAGAGVWSVPLMAPVAVSALRKLNWDFTE